MNPDVLTWVVLYSAVMSVAFLVALIIVFRCRHILKKNKSKYDLRDLKFFLEPIDDENYILTINYGITVLYHRRVSESDIFTDPKFLYKEFVKWCEENHD